MEDLQELLSKHRLRNTSFRQSVLKLFVDAFPKALSRTEVENTLQKDAKIDRVTLYRTLKSFEEVGLIHVAIDNSNEQRFALCSESCDGHHHDDNHAHFYCKNCKQTVCLEEVNIPNIKVPGNYQLQDTQIVLSGICKDCS